MFETIQKLLPGTGSSLFALLLLLMTGCSSTATKLDASNEPETASDTTVTSQIKPTEEVPASQRAEPMRPKVELTDEILYKILLAEIAGQRGMLDISLENYLQLARMTRDPKVIERTARIAVYARDDEAATEAAKLWIEVDPNNTDAHQVMAVMSIRAGNIDDSLQHLEKILESTDGKLDQKLWLIANLLGREKDQQLVLTVMERLMEDRQEDPEALFAYAHVIARLGNLEKSQALLEKVLVLAPGNNNAALSYVSVLQRQDKINEALAWLEDSLKQEKENFNLHLIYARLLADAKRYDDARREFELLSVKAPNNNDVLYALGLLYLQSNRLEEAEPYFLRLSENKQLVNEANYYLGRIAEEHQQYDKAGSWYQGVEKGENYFDAQIRLSFILSKQGKIEQAREHLRSVRFDTPQEKSMLIQAEGELLTGEDRLEEAMQVYDEALNGDYDADILYSRAMLAEKMDRLDILEADLKRIIDHDPKHSQALNALGYTLADRTERYDEALGYIQRALEVSPNDFYILDSMGWVLYRLGRLDEAVSYLRRAMELRPDPEIAAHLGEVLWVMGEKDRAYEIWNTALQETPDDSRLLDVIKRFGN